MKESLQNIRDIIVKPSAAFTRLKSEPKWLLALTLCCLVAAVKNYAVLDVFVVFVVFAIPAFHVVLSVLLTAAARIFKVNKAVKFRHIFASLIHVTFLPFPLRLQQCL